MAVSAKWYGRALLALLNKEADLNSDTIKVSLHTSTYTPDQDAHDYVNDLSGELTAGGGYTTGGVTLAGVAVTYDAATNTMKVDADDAVWAALTKSGIRYAVIYDDTPATAATKPLLGYVDFGEDLASLGGPFTIQWAAGGIFTSVVS